MHLIVWWSQPCWEIISFLHLRRFWLSYHLTFTECAQSLFFAFPICSTQTFMGELQGPKTWWKRSSFSLLVWWHLLYDASQCKWSYNSFPLLAGTKLSFLKAHFCFRFKIGSLLIYFHMLHWLLFHSCAQDTVLQAGSNPSLLRSDTTTLCTRQRVCHWEECTSITLPDRHFFSGVIKAMDEVWLFVLYMRYDFSVIFYMIDLYLILCIEHACGFESF
jgi:hypothetical protein